MGQGVAGEGGETGVEGRGMSEEVSKLYYKAQPFHQLPQTAAARRHLHPSANARFDAQSTLSGAIHARSQTNLTFAGSGGQHQANRVSLPDDRSELEPLDQDQPIPYSHIEDGDHDAHEERNLESGAFRDIRHSEGLPREQQPSQLSDNFGLARYAGHKPKNKFTNAPGSQNNHLNPDSNTWDNNQSQDPSAQFGEQDLSDCGPSFNAPRVGDAADGSVDLGLGRQALLGQDHQTLQAPADLNSSQSLHEKASSSREYFSFVNQQRSLADAQKADMGSGARKTQYQASMSNPYILHRNSPLIREKDSASVLDRETPKLVQAAESSEFQNSGSSKKENRKQRPSEVQQRLQQIEMQVQQKQMEINKQRMQAKFNGIHLDYFRPESAHQALDSDPAYDSFTFDRAQPEPKDDPSSWSQNVQGKAESSKRQSFVYHSNQGGGDVKNDYYQRVDVQTNQRGRENPAEDEGRGDRSSLLLKQAHSLPSSSHHAPKTVSQNSRPITSKITEGQSLLPAEAATLKGTQGTQEYSQVPLNQTGLGAEKLNSTMQSRQFGDNFGFNNSAQLESDLRDGNNQFSSSDFKINENHLSLFDGEESGRISLVAPHERNQLHATDTAASAKPAASAKESRNIRQIISTIERNQELSQLDLSLDLKSQMKQCSTTRRHALQSREENFLFEQYGLSTNVVIHPQDRKRMQDMGPQQPQRPAKTSGSGGLAKTKNLRSLKNLRSMRQNSQVEPASPPKIDKQPSLTLKKQQKSQSSALKKAKNSKSDRKSVLKKEISLYPESDDKVQVSQFTPQEATPVQPRPVTKKKWLPSIESVPALVAKKESVVQAAVSGNNENNSSSNSELPQPQLYSQIAPQPMDLQPLMQTSDQSAKNSRESLGYRSSDSNISLIEEERIQHESSRASLLNQSDAQFHAYNSVHPVTVNHSLHQTQSKTPSRHQGSGSPPKHRNKDLQAEILQHLLKEEDVLYQYATESIHEIQRTESSLRNQSAEAGARNHLVIYQKLLLDAHLEKPRFILFARQLQVSFMITKALIRVLPPSLMTRFESKLRALCQNIHQSFLLIIDLVLKQFQWDSSGQEGYYSVQRSDIHQSIDFKLLRNITSKKIKSKDNFARTLTIFRQNNEINILYLKKIIKYILDSYSTDCSPFKALASEFQEIIRVNYGSVNTATGAQSSNREESKAINHALLALKEKETRELHLKLQDQVETLISKPGVILNKSRQVANANNVREPVHQSPQKQEEDIEQQASPQPQTYRHLSPMKTTKDSFAAKDHEVLKRCKSTSKNIQITKTNLRAAQQHSYGQKAAVSREAHNMSISSALQKQRMNPVLSQNVYKGLNEMPVENQRRNHQTSQQSEITTQHNVAQSQPTSVQELISASTVGKNMGVLAHRRNSKKQSTSPNVANATIRRGAYNQHSSSVAMHPGVAEKLMLPHQNSEENSEADLSNVHSSERAERQSSNALNARSVKSNLQADSQQRTISSQAPGTSTKTQSTLGAEYIRKKYDPQGYRRVNSGSSMQGSQKYQCRFNDRDRHFKSPLNEHSRPQLKVRVGDNKQPCDLNSSLGNSSVLQQQQPTPLVSQKRASLGQHSPTKVGSQNTAGSPQKVNSLMKRYGSTSKLQTIPHPPTQQLASITQPESYPSKVKLLPSQQQTPHQFNKSMSGSAQIQSSASKPYPSSMRAGSDRKHQTRQQEIQKEACDGQNASGAWGFILPESKDFILRMSNDGQEAERSMIAQSYLPSDQGRPQGSHFQKVSEQPIAQITNVNNNINFYGTVVNHVYSPADTGRESQRTDTNQNDKYFSPQKVPQAFRQQQSSSHPKSIQQAGRSRRLTTEKKSSQAYMNKGDDINQSLFNEYILENVEEGRAIQMHDPDSALFKPTSPDSRPLAQGKALSKFNEINYDHSILVENLDTSMLSVNNQKVKNSFAQSFLFEPSTPTLVSPEKKGSEFLHKSQRSVERERADYSYSQSGKKVPLTEKQPHHSKMHSSGTGIGSGLKNLKSKQQSLSHLPARQSYAKNATSDKVASGRKKDTRKEVVKPQLRPNQPQSQRDTGLSPPIMSQKSGPSANHSHRNSADCRATQEESPTKPALTTSNFKAVEVIEPSPQAPPARADNAAPTQQEEIRQYNLNLLEAEQQTNISSSFREQDNQGDSKREVLEPETELKPATKLRMFQSEEIEEQQVKESQGASADPGEAKEEEEEEEVIDQDDEQALIDAEYRRLRKLVREPYLPPLSQTELSRLPTRAKCIEDVYTLVLDLDETLIHFEMDEDVDPAIEEPGYYLIRPGAIKFLNELAEYYELVVFTAAMPDYADWILDNVDRHKKISHRLYRQHSTPFEDYAMKDLTKLGRDMSKTMIIDNLAENFNQLTPLNGIWVESWYDDMDDIVLQLLVPFLIDIVKSKVDVRHILTDPIKEQLIYKRLDEGKPLPTVREIFQKFSKKQ